MSTLKEQLDIAEKKLAFFEKKKLLGGLSLDQEFALNENIKKLEGIIADLKEQIANDERVTNNEEPLKNNKSNIQINNNSFQSNKKTKTENGDLAKISCDRKNILRRFVRNLDKKEEAKIPCQFYFLAEQPYGEVESLLKRLVNHLKQEKPKTKLTNYEDIEPIEVYSTDEFMQDDVEYELRKGFNKGFKKNIQVKSIQELVEMIPTNYPQLKEYTHIPISFKINMTNQCWQNSVRKALVWFINTFAKVEKSNYTFVFFIIVKARKSKKITSTKKDNFLSGLFKKKKTETIATIDIYEALNVFTADYKHVTVLPPLSKVDRTDLDDWYKIYESNAADRKIEVDKLVKRLIDRTKHDEPWSMSHVESELGKIVHVLKNAQYEI